LCWAGSIRGFFLTRGLLGAIPSPARQPGRSDGLRAGNSMGAHCQLVGLFHTNVPQSSYGVLSLTLAKRCGPRPLQLELPHTLQSVTWLAEPQALGTSLPRSLSTPSHAACLPARPPSLQPARGPIPPDISSPRRGGPRSLGRHCQAGSAGAAQWLPWSRRSCSTGPEHSSRRRRQCRRLPPLTLTHVRRQRSPLGATPGSEHWPAWR